MSTDSFYSKLAMDTLLNLEQARRDCYPYLGEIVHNPEKRPSDLYKMVLEGRGVDLTGVDESAYPAMLKVLRGSGATNGAEVAKAEDAMRTDFPDVARIR